MTPIKNQRHLYPGAVYDYDGQYDRIGFTGNIAACYQQANQSDWAVQAMSCLSHLGGMGAGLNQAFQPPQQFQQIPERHPLPADPQKKSANYSYELIQDVKAGVPFVVPKLFSANEPQKQGEKSPTEETVLHAPSLAVFG